MAGTNELWAYGCRLPEAATAAERTRHRAGGSGYSCVALPAAGKILPYLLTRSIQITPLTVIAKGAMSKAQSEKCCKATAVMAIPRRTIRRRALLWQKRPAFESCGQLYLELPVVPTAAPWPGDAVPVGRPTSRAAIRRRSIGRWGQSRTDRPSTVTSVRSV
jgi:hypothetical protein